MIFSSVRRPEHYNILQQVWSDLREAMVLPFGFLKRQALLLYMQTHIAPMIAPPEEDLLHELQPQNPEGGEFAVGDSVKAAPDVIRNIVDDPRIVNPA